MKTLVLIRHAKSSWKDAGLDDVDRPLNKRGRRDAPAMAQALAGLGIRPEVFLSSPARRTETTARIIARHLHLPAGYPHLEPAIYEADWEELLKVVRARGGQAERLWLCGHNPGLLDLLNQLSDSRLGKLPSGAIAAIRFPVGDWQALEPRHGSLIMLLTPKALRSDVR